jgi:hypothetical protein
MYHHRNVMLSAAKHLVLRPFASLRVTHKCANLVWFDLVSIFCQDDFRSFNYTAMGSDLTAALALSALLVVMSFGVLFGVQVAPRRDAFGSYA